jgi:hypothetical protein
MYQRTTPDQSGISKQVYPSYWGTQWHRHTQWEVKPTMVTPGTNETKARVLEALGKSFRWNTHALPSQLRVCPWTGKKQPRIGTCVSPRDAHRFVDHLNASDKPVSETRSDCAVRLGPTTEKTQELQIQNNVSSDPRACADDLLDDQRWIEA